MADLRVEQKKGPGIWPWILGLVLLGLVLWFIFGGDDDAEITDDIGATAPAAVTTESDMEPSGYASRPAAVVEFTEFAEQAAPDNDEASQHEYAATGIRLLTDALAGVLAGTASPELADLRKKAEAVTSSPYGSDRHAEMVRSAFLSAVEVFKSLPDAEPASGIEEAAEAIRAGVPLLEQQVQIQEFFERAADALQT